MAAPPIATAESYPFDTSAILTETQFYDLSRVWSGDGILDEPYGNLSGALVVDSGSRQVTVRAYYAHVGGAIANQPTDVVIDMPAASSQDRLDRVVTRREPGADQCVIDVLSGTPGSGVAPMVTQNRSGVWEFSHGYVPVHADASLGNVVDERIDVGRGLRYGRSNWRPPDALPGEMFYEWDVDRVVQKISATGGWRVLHDDTGWRGFRLANHVHAVFDTSVRRADGIVYVRGYINHADGLRFQEDTITLAVLPQGFRPGRTTRVPCRVADNGGVVGALTIDTDGAVAGHFAGQPSWISFDSITFPADN